MNPLVKNSPRLLLIMAVIGLLVRIVFVWHTQHIGSPASMDSRTYHTLAIHLLEGKGFSSDGVNPSIYEAPLYPFFVASIYAVFGVHPLIVELVQCLLGVLIAYLTYLIARILFSIEVALLSFIVVLFLPELLIMTTYLYTELLFICFLLASTFYILKSLDTPKWQLLVIAGLLMGLAALTRGIALMVPVLFFIAALCKMNFFKAIRATVIFGLAMTAVLVPWTIRNYSLYHRLIPIAVTYGDSLWIGTYLPFDGKYNYKETMELIEELTEGMDPIARNQAMIDEAKKNIAADPLQVGWLTVRKAFRYWWWVYEAPPTGQPRTSTSFASLILKTVYYPLLFFGIWGLLACLSRWRDLIYFYGLLLYFTASHAMLLVVPRYRFPLLPILALFAVIGIRDLFTRWAARRKVSLRI